jgi:hypothetical protein
MTLYLFLTPHNCGTTGRIYENGLYSQNVFIMSTVMTGKQTRLISRFTPQLALKLPLHGTEIWRVSWHYILPHGSIIAGHSVAFPSLAI